MNRITKNQSRHPVVNPFGNSRFHTAAAVSVLILLVLAAISGLTISQSDLFRNQSRLDQPKFGSIKEVIDETETSPVENNAPNQEETKRLGDAIESTHKTTTEMPPSPEEHAPRQVGSPQASNYEEGLGSINSISAERPTPVHEKGAERESNALPPADTTPSIVKEEPNKDSTKVEEAPKPIEEMSKESVEDKVAEYKRWIDAGQMEVEFDYSQIKNDEMSTIVATYYVASQNYTFRVDGGGVAPEQVSEKPDLHGLLIALPRYQLDWPTPPKKLASDMGTIREAYFVVQNQVALGAIPSRWSSGNEN